MHKLIISIRQYVLLFVVSLAAAVSSAAQQFDFPQATVEDPAALTRSMNRLAGEVLSAYREDDRDRYLDNLFRLQLVAGRYADAVKSLAGLIA